MKSVVLVFANVVLALLVEVEAGEIKGTLPPPPEGKSWKLVWHDEFDGEALDESKWDVPPDGKRRDAWWMRKAVKLNGKGQLVISTIKEDDKYIDGCVRTLGKFEHAFGYYVARIKLQEQLGHWSAFWLMGSGVGRVGDGGRDGTEIDIMEKPWLDDRVQHAMHWDGYGEHHRSAAKVANVPGVMEGFHTFALLWMPDEYVFYVDGKETWRTKAGGVCQAPLYIKLSDEVGKWGGDITKAKLPDQFLVDYVRVYDLVAAEKETEEPLTKSEPLVIDGKSELTISGLRITNPDGNGITIRNSKNVRVEGCRIGPCKGEAVSIYACDGVVVTKNHFEDIRTGVYEDSQRIQVTYNKCLNVHGPFPRGQMAQFNNVIGKGNQISFNIAENILGKSHAEDAINLYKSNGTADDPIRVIGNRIRGGGPSGSGGGIMTGDAGGSYTLVKDNVLVDPGQYGIAISSGHHIQILNNKVYGKKQPFTNVGIYVWNQYKPACHSHTVRGNQVRWYNREGTENPCWDGSNCGPIEGWADNNWHADLDASVLPENLMGSGMDSPGKR